MKTFIPLSSYHTYVELEPLFRFKESEFPGKAPGGLALIVKLGRLGREDDGWSNFKPFLIFCLFSRLKDCGETLSLKPSETKFLDFLDSTKPGLQRVSVSDWPWTDKTAA